MSLTLYTFSLAAELHCYANTSHHVYELKMLKLPILAVKSSQKHSSTQDSDEETLLVSALDCLPEE